MRHRLIQHPVPAVAGTVTIVVLVGVAVGLAIGAFAPQPLADASPSASESVGQSAAPSSAAGSADASVAPAETPASIPGFETPADILPPGSVVVVVTETLQIRAGPGLDTSVVYTAAAGDRFALQQFVGPVAGDGLEWYRLGVAGDSVLWATAGSGTERYLEVVPPVCPAGDPDLGTVVEMINDWDRLACFGNRPLSLVGTYGCGGCGGTQAGSFEPFWLAGPVRAEYLWVEFGRSRVLHLHVAPESGVAFPPDGSIVRVTGHFNDPASASCRISVDDDGQVTSIDPGTAELYCREQFVVDGFEVIGLDPEFP
jgi:hypothetical protein